MIKSALKKLNSKSGASIMMALLMLLVAVMVSAVIVSAAVTAVQNAKTDAANRQAMLDATSAAELLKNEFNGAKYEWSQVTHYEYNRYWGWISYSDAAATAVTGCNIGGIIEDAFEAALTGNMYTTTLNLKEENMGDVSVAFKMQNAGGDNYEMTAEISSAAGEKNSVLMIVSATGSYETLPSERYGYGYQYLETAKKAITWSNAEVRKGSLP